MILEIQDLSAGPASPPVLQGIELALEDGGRTAVLGPSGVGKTTLLRAICGLLRPSAGRIRVAEQLVFGPGVDVPPARRAVAMVFQSFALWPHLSVAEHVRLVDPDGQAPDWLERLGLADKRRRLPGQLSGGEQARLSLARALSSRPRLLLLDEPFRNLDPVLARELRAELLAWFEQTRQSVLLVTHDPEEAEQLAPRWCVLGADGIVAHDTPDALRRAPSCAAVAGLFGRVDLLPARWLSPGRMSTPLGEAEAVGEADADAVLVGPEVLLAESDSGSGTKELEARARFREAGRDVVRLSLGEHTLHARVEAADLGAGIALRITEPLRAVRRPRSEDPRS